MERVSELVVRKLLAIEIAGQQILVGLDDRLDELLAVLAHALGLFVFRKLGDGILRTFQDLPVEQVDRGLELLFFAERHVQGYYADAVGLAELPENLVKVGVLPIEAADDHYARRLVLLELGPDGLRADLDPGGRIDKDDRGIRDPQRGVLVAGEVGVTGRVDEVDLRALVRERREGHVDGDVALLLFRIRVEDAGAVVDLAETRRRADRMEDGLDEARLARSAVANDGHISDLRGLR